MNIKPLTSLLPSVEFILAFNDTGLKAMEGIPDHETIDNQKLIKILSSVNKPYAWFDYSEISVGMEQYVNRQLDLLEHSNEPILIINTKYISELDTENIYIIKFVKHTSNKNLFYGRDQKYLIFTSIYLWLTNYVNQSKVENSSTDDIINVVKNQSVIIDNLNNKLTNCDFLFYKHFHQLIFDVVKDKLRPNQKITLSENCLDVLKSFEGNLDELKTGILKAFTLATTLFPNSLEIRLKAYYFKNLQKEIKKENLDELSAGISNEKIEPKETKTTENTDKNKVHNQIIDKKPKTRRTESSRKEKTIQLLDRYELAIAYLIKDSLPILGKNIASACIPQISPPALTDSINKHKSRISECLIKYPDHWPLLRQNYNPIKNLELTESI